MQVLPGAPGTARQGPARSIMLVNDGGIATQPQAPGHDRPFTTSTGAAKHGRLSAAPRAPGADVPPATPARAPGQYRPRAVAIATVALPAGPHRLRQESLPHTPANPRTLTYSYSHHTISSLQLAPQSIAMHTPDHRANSPSLQGRGRGLGPTRPPLLPLSTCWRGGRGVRPKPHQAHPAIQVPPRPRSCSTACTGLSHHHPARAPPTPTHRLVIAAQAAIHTSGRIFCMSVPCRSARQLFPLPFREGARG